MRFLRLPRPTHRVFARRDPAKRPRVTVLVLAVLALKIAVDAWRRRRGRGAETTAA
ncbi:hypothetical protein BJ123_12522 [Rhodopseudomonas thermotolerans]|uniref:Uncharacterized protein n=2 Tax=Rhodopseudomonas TaxID=1073 RepID=A0A336JSQ1_9BRAD|nr:hypothetical protein BJ125_12522 [Rhodopseudomonas pentothenatexigens]REF91205.1 hypothetical protein BJ123_12522 [Rhodopseudomonas thermotolerans]SSW92815.1 hypothetical protein SAMN05892882_12522 [Rhodopseudomonas pentothenatexigens]